MHQENNLKRILKEYPDVWMDYKKFKALLMDFFPEDKITRNLLLISSEERIPDEIKSKAQLTLQERKAFAKRIVSACNCNVDDADRIVVLWIEAFESYQIFEEEFQFRYIDREAEIMELEIPSRTCMVLKRSGILTVQDLIDRRHEIMYVRNLGRKSFEDVARVLLELGYDTIQYPIRKRVYAIDEEQNSANVNSVLNYLVLARKFNDVENRKMFVCALEKAAIEGYRGDYTSVILVYYFGSYGIEKDLNKAFFYAWKWNKEYETRALVDLPSADEQVYVRSILLLLLLDGYGRFDDEARNLEVNKCIRNIVEAGIELTSDDTTENLLLLAIGLGCCIGELDFSNVMECAISYDIDVDVPLGCQALTIASNNGVYAATKSLMVLFRGADFMQSYRGNTKGYEYLVELYFMAWNQNQEDLLVFWKTSVFDKVDCDIDIASLELPATLKLRLREVGINKYSDIQKNDLNVCFKDYNLEVNDWVRIVAAISQYVEEGENA